MSKYRIVIKGENGNSDVRWRDVLFKLSAICGGATDLKKINERIQNCNFELTAPVSPHSHNIGYLKSKQCNLIEEIFNHRVKYSIKQKNWLRFFDLLESTIKMKGSGEFLAESDEISREYSHYFKKLADKFYYPYKPKSQEFYAYIIERLRLQHSSELKLLELLSEVGEVDLLNIEDSSEIKDLKNELAQIRASLKRSTIDFEEFCRQIYNDHNGEKIADLLPVKSSARITRKYNVRLRTSGNYDKGVYYGKIIKAWESMTGEKAYPGLFLGINRDYSFDEMPADELGWNLPYENYVPSEDHVPVISCKSYMSTLSSNINLDTIRLKSREPISLMRMNEIERKWVTRKIMTLGHNGSKKVHELKNFSCLFRLQVPEDLDYYNIKFLNSETSKELLKSSKFNKIYSNATMYLSHLKFFEAAIRINKTEMFVRKRTIFNIYRFVSQLEVTFQKLIRSRFESVTETKDGAQVPGIKLDYLPRLTFCSQADVYQPISKEHLREMHLAAFDSEISSATTNRFIAYKLLDYLHLTGYDKKASALYKTNHYLMQDFEKNVFDREGDELYRSEIKFKLRRNFYETLSYVFALHCIKQESFLDLIKSPKSRFSRKILDFRFDSRVPANVEFNEQKCTILFAYYNMYQGRELNLNQETAIPGPPLEGPWVFDAQSPPQTTELLEKFKVRWRLECSKIVNKDMDHDRQLEIIRDF